MRFILGLATLIVFLSAQAFAFPSAELKDLWDISLAPVGYEILDSYRRGSVQVEEIYYQSRSYKGRPVEIFGYFCYPAKAAGKLPAILLVHGGGGTAHLGRTVSWARRGYAILTIDLPGRGEQRWSSRSTGPDMDVPVLLRTKPDPSHNYLVHAVAAARNGITFLTERKEVDPKRIGMVGLSWGGVITLLTNGQDKRLKTAVNVFGAGYIPEGCTWQDRFDMKSEEDLRQWYAYIDPKNFLKTQHAPILFITGTNDHCYYLPTFQKSYEEVTVPKKLLLIPNLRHRFLPYMQRIVWNWLDGKLKYNGSFPEAKVLAVFEKENGKLIVPVMASAASHITKATLYYTKGEPSRWTRRNWQSIDAYYEDGIYYFGIPKELIDPEMMFYVSVKDNHGSAVSTPIRSIFKVKMFRGEETYAISSPIKKINIHEPPLQLLGFLKNLEFPKVFFSKETKSYHLVLPEAGS
ncbi:MAG: alpha/beta fold hydrolase [Candidatus Margulisiibacteriota bacterium]